MWLILVVSYMVLCHWEVISTIFVTILYRKPPERKPKCLFSGDHGYDNKINSMQVHDTYFPV